MLAMTDRNGNVFASVPGLANRARVTVEQAEIAINKFLSPDRYSRTPDNEGRRIAVIDGGWLLLNHAKYRALRDDADRKEYQKEWIRNKRQNLGSAEISVDHVVDNVDTVSTDVDHSRPRSTYTDADTDAEKNKSRRRASRLPDDWVLNREREGVAKAEGLDAQRTYAKFCDYWRSVSGSKATKLDWNAVWRNWCKTERDNRRPSAGTVEHRQAREFPS